MSRRIAWIASLGLALTVAGCISRPRLTEAHAAGCVVQTFAYLEMKRGIPAGDVRTVTDTGKDGILVHVIQDRGTGVGNRLGTFRVRENRRIDVWDAQKENWRTVGSCD